MMTEEHADVRLDPEAEAGFSVLELLVGLTLLSIISVVTLSSIRTLSQTQNRVSQSITLQNSFGLESYLRRLISHAQHQPQMADNSRAIWFRGSRSSLQFFTTHTVPGQFAGLYQAQFRCHGMSPRKLSISLQLVRFPGDARNPMLAGDGHVGNPLQISAPDCAFRFVGRHDNSNRPIWTDTWVGTLPPSHVEVVLEDSELISRRHIVSIEVSQR